MISQLLVSLLRPRLGIFVPLIQGKTAVNQGTGGSLTLLHLICRRPLPPPARPDNSIRVSVCQNSKNRIFFICLHCHFNNSFLLNQQIINIFPQTYFSPLPRSETLLKNLLNFFFTTNIFGIWEIRCLFLHYWQAIAKLKGNSCHRVWLHTTHHPH